MICSTFILWLLQQAVLWRQKAHNLIEQSRLGIVSSMFGDGDQPLQDLSRASLELPLARTNG